MRVQTIFILSLVSSIWAQQFTVPNVNITFSEDVLPFHVYVDPVFIENTRQKVADARMPTGTEYFPSSDGPVIGNWTNVRNVWTNDYNWEGVQASINANLRQYTTIVQPYGSNYTAPVPLHFVHHKSPRSDAIPLLFVHGWPGNYLEVSNIIGFLTNPPNDTLPAFHVVAPSIPGFAFSPAPVQPGFGPIAAAHTFNALMEKLGYSRYVAQGGDWGGVIIRYQAAFYPESLITILDNLFVIQPNSTDLARFAANQTTAEESAYINNINFFETQNSGYRFIQQTQPLALAYALTDSPLGMTMWIEKLIEGSIDFSIPTTPVRFNASELITWTLMYYIQGPYAASRIYKEAGTDGAWSGFGFGSLPYIAQPIAITEYPHDIWYGLPLDWAQRGGNVKVRFVHDRGGHFAAYEVPELLAGDIWSWFGNREASGTEVFYR